MQRFKNRGEADKGPLCEDCVSCSQAKRVAAAHQCERERLARSSRCGKRVNESQGCAVHFLQTRTCNTTPVQRGGCGFKFHAASQRLIQFIKQSGISFIFRVLLQERPVWSSRAARLAYLAYLALRLQLPGKISS